MLRFIRYRIFEMGFLKRCFVSIDAFQWLAFCCTQIPKDIFSKEQNGMVIFMIRCIFGSYAWKDSLTNRTFLGFIEWFLNYKTEFTLGLQLGAIKWHFDETVNICWLNIPNLSWWLEVPWMSVLCWVFFEPWKIVLFLVRPFSLCSEGD